MELYINIVVDAAIDAGREIMKWYEKIDVGIDYKGDNSPVTNADKSANSIIDSFLSKTAYPIISEESIIPDYEVRKSFETYWLVDPLDGTKDFIKKDKDFTVNIALIHQNKPIFGVIYLPVDQQLYVGIVGEGGFKFYIDNNFDFDKLIFNNPIEYIKTDTHTILVSKSYISKRILEYIESIKKENPDTKTLACGSSKKFCLIADGIGSIYPRFSSIMEWDIAAGHALLKAIGGNVLNIHKEEVTYGSYDLRTPPFIGKM